MDNSKMNKVSVTLCNILEKKDGEQLNRQSNYLALTPLNSLLMCPASRTVLLSLRLRLCKCLSPGFSEGNHLVINNFY